MQEGSPAPSKPGSQDSRAKDVESNSKDVSTIWQDAMYLGAELPEEVGWVAVSDAVEAQQRACRLACCLPTSRRPECPSHAHTCRELLQFTGLFRRGKGRLPLFLATVRGAVRWAALHQEGHRPRRQGHSHIHTVIFRGQTSTSVSRRAGPIRPAVPLDCAPPAQASAAAPRVPHTGCASQLVRLAGRQAFCAQAGVVDRALLQHRWAAARVQP